MATNLIDTTTAVAWGAMIQAAYAQFQNSPNEVNPATITGLPDGYMVVRTIQMTDFIVAPTGTPKFYGFLAVGGDPRTQVIALRGTATMTEWWDVLHFDLVPFDQIPNGQGGKVSEGFSGIYGTLTTMDPVGGSSSGHLAPYLDASLPLVVTGHSLGGALATLLAADLAYNTNVQPQVWTFASPKVGDANFASAYGLKSTVSWRIYNVLDIVPAVPVELVDNYQSVNAGYAISSAGQTRWSIACAHELGTYLHILSGGSTDLSPKCGLTAGG